MQQVCGAFEVRVADIAEHSCHLRDPILGVERACTGERPPAFDQLFNFNVLIAIGCKLGEMRDTEDLV